MALSKGLPNKISEEKIKQVINKGGSSPRDVSDSKSESINITFRVTARFAERIDQAIKENWLGEKPSRASWVRDIVRKEVEQAGV